MPTRTHVPLHSEAEWHAFVLRVRRDLFHLHAPTLVSSEALAQVPVTYQEDLYGLQPLAVLAKSLECLSTPRVNRVPTRANAIARNRRLHAFENEGEWLVATGGSIMRLGNAHSFDQIPQPTVVEKDGRFTRDLVGSIRRNATNLTTLALMVEQPELVASALAGHRVWRGLHARQDLNEQPLLDATIVVYERWLPMYADLITRGF